MKATILRTFIFTSTLYFVCHLIFYIPGLIIAGTRINFPEGILFLLIFAIFSCLVAILFIMVILVPIQILRKRLRLKNKYYWLLSVILSLLVVTIILYWIGASAILMDNDTQRIAHTNFDYYKELPVFYLIDYLFNYLIVIASIYFFNRQIKKTTDNNTCLLHNTNVLN